jgi:hypothetical protein
VRFPATLLPDEKRNPQHDEKYDRERYRSPKIHGSAPLPWIFDASAGPYVKAGLI